MGIESESLKTGVARELLFVTLLLLNSVQKGPKVESLQSRSTLEIKLDTKKVHHNQTTVAKRARTYQLFALHALHQRLKQVDGFTLAEVEGFLDGCNNVVLHPVRKAAAGQFTCQPRVKSHATQSHTHAIKCSKYRSDLAATSWLITLRQQ